MIGAVLTVLDGGATVRECLDVLRRDLHDLPRRIVVVGKTTEGMETIAREPGVECLVAAGESPSVWRNEGLARVEDADHVLLLDGGVVPMIGSIPALRAYLERRPGVDVVGPEVFASSREHASLRMPTKTPSLTTRRSERAPVGYCLCRRRAFEGIRFPEEGPFSEGGLGVEDVVLAARWARAHVVVETFLGGTPFRERPRVPRDWLSREFGSVYEKRFVRYTQEYPDHWLGGVKETLIVRSRGDWRAAARLLRAYRDEVADLRHEVIFVPDDSEATREFVYRHAQRFHGGDRTFASDGSPIERLPADPYWCGDFRTASSLEAAERMRTPGSCVVVGDVERQTWARKTAGRASSPLKKSRREAKRASAGLGTRRRDSGGGLYGR